ncbi:DNA polymerase zeta catalytic subunit-like isoform X2 [Xenia sp. Carnegie-2017]|uniref:DNA polymerase zeta catalytic subunit-like isoform X2 n=1 Tax=Xenia sp. Carnegie-2017 TaxID=2897299 RepID=UPI001F04B59F|nr:DNA polymerase zeta catalytic subunit-like isoform X2 [Xenia sp. Carnegie-2017]
MLSGYVEPAHISKFQFDNQLKTFSSYGYALDPSDDTAHIEEKFVGDVEKAKDSKGLTVFEATKQLAGDWKKRENKADPGVIDGYKGPWSKFVDEETIAKPSEEESTILEEYELSKKNKSKKDDMKPSEEKSALHIKDAYDYQGRSYLHIPQDLCINLKSDTPPERCFLPKQHIHTWSGHTKGVSAIRFFPKSAHLLLSCSMDCKIKKLQNDIHVSTNGSVFVKSNIRRGILPRMLEEILDTRIMVKKAMKDCKDDKTLLQLLDARQLALKLIANVTYGYTSTNFSGRMPCVEIADAIVRKARETLERAINLVNTRDEWGSRVVYGDTDSLFVLVKGASKEKAFKIGKEIVDAVTAENPKPVKLKFEKVYMPCVLQTKKCYVGYMYETLEQKDPVFDAKGIETVRRDTCPAVAKILEKSLRILFEERDVSLVKKFVQRQFVKMMKDRVSIQDFIFAKEYRGMKRYKPKACVPALEIARRHLSRDRRVGERVPYVIVNGSPGLPLIQLVKDPIDVLNDRNLRLNTIYYVQKQILPPLDRVFSLIGVDVFSWYTPLPRYIPRHRVIARKQKRSISRFFTTLHCPVCEQLTQHGLCQSYRSNPQKSVFILASRVGNWERKYSHLKEICFQCCGARDEQLSCISLDCPVMFKLEKLKTNMEYGMTLRDFQKTIEESYGQSET